MISLCHTLTGVWVEINAADFSNEMKLSHTLTGVWVEIESAFTGVTKTVVTPSRVCELKLKTQIETTAEKSHPHGCVSWNGYGGSQAEMARRHTLTGVWVEIDHATELAALTLSHPHGCVSWNIAKQFVIPFESGSHPHGCVSWNTCDFLHRVMS